MHIMTEFEVYKFYLALKLHFTTDKYDVIQQRGKVRASKTAFARRKDLYSLKKVARTYSDKEIADFLVANFVSGDRWGGMFDIEAKDRYLEWKKRQESLGYIFSNDISTLTQDMDLFATFEAERGKHPYILKQYLSKQIHIETLVLLDKMFGFVDKYSAETEDTFVWPDIARLIKKYRPFLRVDLEKYYGTIERRTGLNRQAIINFRESNVIDKT